MPRKTRAIIIQHLPSCRLQRHFVSSYIERYQSPYGVEDIFRLVTDFSQYEKFVPWCESSSIRREQVGNATLDFAVRSKTLCGRVVMDVDFHSGHKVVFKYANGPWPGIERLICTWSLKETSQGRCVITVKVEFHLSSFLLRRLADLLFGYVVKRLVTAFQDRARALYGDNPLRSF